MKKGSRGRKGERNYDEWHFEISKYTACKITRSCIKFRILTAKYKNYAFLPRTLPPRARARALLTDIPYFYASAIC